jgi:hypothetical protein
MTPQQIYDHEYYMRNRERILAKRREYWHTYQKYGLIKPRKPHQPRSIRDHERYLEKRDEIRERQRAYYQAHRDEILYKKRNGLIR